ncbi:hypothetical protein INR49_027957 [Caranx melampygus]|nr:hypothetical protein INR49_027957 [Caranx melampygus]
MSDWTDQSVKASPAALFTAPIRCHGVLHILRQPALTFDQPLLPQDIKKLKPCLQKSPPPNHGPTSCPMYPTSGPRASVTASRTCPSVALPFGAFPASPVRLHMRPESAFVYLCWMPMDSSHPSPQPSGCQCAQDTASRAKSVTTVCWPSSAGPAPGVKWREKSKQDQIPLPSSTCQSHRN